MSDEASAPKKQRLDAEAENDQNDMQVVGPSDREIASPPTPPLPSIFKLTSDCCDEMFEYLSLVDLHSFGQTCKIFNKVAGEYFKQNYSAKCFFINRHGISDRGYYAQNSCLPGFIQYITLKMINYEPNSYKYIAKYINGLTSIKYLMCSDSTLLETEIIQKILPTIEFSHFTNFGINISKDFFDKFSEMCPNLKYLHVQNNDYPNESYEYRWLHQVYPNLTHLRCSHCPPIDDLNIFFERNRGVRHFSVRIEEIWRNKDRLLNSTIKLDFLDVFASNVKSSDFYNGIELLNQLYERRFYKHLHLRLRYYDQQCSDKLLTIPGLKSLFVIGVEKVYKLPQLTQLTRLDLMSSYLNSNEMELLANGLVNLERLSVAIKSFDIILPFIRRSINLNKIKLWGEGRILNLPMLDKERAKLNGARKVTIYVDDDVFLTMKWATENGDTNLSLVEMRRNSSFEWDESIKFH